MSIKPVPFAIASDAAASPAWSKQRLLNVYPESSPTRAKSDVLILGRGGLKPWGISGSGPIRGACLMDDILYVVSGASLYSVSASGTVIATIGTVDGSGFVIMSQNGKLGSPGQQLVIATENAWVDYLDGYFIWGRNGTGKAYLYNADTTSFGEISDPSLFLSGQGKFQISAVLDGSSYDALDFATAEASPSKLIRGKVDGSDLLLFCENHGEPWYNSGAADFTFARQNQTTIRKGILGTHLIALLDNTTIWIGTDPEAGGGAIVYRLQGGFQGQRISTHAVEDVLSNVADWQTVRCISYIVNGHAFFHIILSDQPSWVYDCATNLWHEESTYGLGRWQGNSMVSAFGKTIIGSCNSGDLFELDHNYYFDGADTLIEREMISTPIGDDATFKTFAKFQVDMQTGVGLANGQGSDPQIMASYSKDRGETWSNEKWRPMGQIGQYGIRVFWTNWGRFRSIMIKVRVTDPVKIAFINYFADIV